jgi:hypothetical protein
LSVIIHVTQEEAERCREKIKELAGREPASLSLPEYMTLLAFARCAVDMVDAAARGDELMRSWQ